MSAAKTSVVSAAKKAATAATSAATSDISIPSTTPFGLRRPPQGILHFIGVSGFAADVAAFLAADTTYVLVADTTDVLPAAEAADGGFVQQIQSAGQEFGTFQSMGPIL